MDEARLLADERGIPWRLPRDVAHFRDYTHGKWLLLGRRTFEEMRGWFRDGHTPLVLTNQCGYEPKVGRAVASVPQAIALAEAAGVDELVVCGGAQVYAAALPFADEMVLTAIAHRFVVKSGAKYFPDTNANEWRETNVTNHAADAQNAWPMRVTVWLKK